MTRTSELLAVTDPSRWGLRRIKSFLLLHFGVVREAETQTTIAGDVLQDEDGNAFIFISRVDNVLCMEPVAEHCAGGLGSDLGFSHKAKPVFKEMTDAPSR